MSRCSLESALLRRWSTLRSSQKSCRDSTPKNHRDKCIRSVVWPTIYGQWWNVVGIVYLKTDRPFPKSKSACRVLNQSGGNEEWTRSRPGFDSASGQVDATIANALPHLKSLVILTAGANSSRGFRTDWKIRSHSSAHFLLHDIRKPSQELELWLDVNFQLSPSAADITITFPSGCFLVIIGSRGQWAHEAVLRERIIYLRSHEAEYPATIVFPLSSIFEVKSMLD